MTKIPAALTKAVEAGDSWLAAITSAIEAGPATLDLNEVHTELTAAFTAAGRDASAAITEADTIAGRYQYNHERHGVSLAQRSALVGLPRVREHLDQALVAFDQQDDLDAAYEELDQLEQAVTDAQDRLQHAVTTGDVDAVMSLRGQAEVALPAKLEQAQLRIRDLEVARAEAVLVAPRSRIDSKQAAEQEAAILAAAAKAEWERLDGLHRTASVDLAKARAAITHGEQTLTTLRRDRDHLATRFQDDQQRRMRRLAGLPEPEQEPEPRRRTGPPIGARSYTQTVINQMQADEPDDDATDQPVHDYTPRVVTR